MDKDGEKLQTLRITLPEDKEYDIAVDLYLNAILIEEDRVSCSRWVGGCMRKAISKILDRLQEHPGASEKVRCIFPARFGLWYLGVTPDGVKIIKDCFNAPEFDEFDANNPLLRHHRSLLHKSVAEHDQEERAKELALKEILKFCTIASAVNGLKELGWYAELSTELEARRYRNEEEQCEYDQNQLWYQVKNNAFFLSPLPSTAHVADMGCGRGLWALDVANAYNDYTVEGWDISDIVKSTDDVSNCYLYLGDFNTTPLSCHPDRRFHLIHGRGLSLCLSQPVFKNCYESLYPGGWLELSEISMIPGGIQDNVSLPAVSRWTDRIGTVLRRYTDIESAMAKFGAEAGFVIEKPNIERRYFQAGDDVFRVFEGMVRGVGVELLTKIQSWEQSQLDISNMLAELKEKNVRLFLEFVTICARKPAQLSIT